MPHRALLPLAALTFAVALATSRYGLVIHELVGHGGTAAALGGHVETVHLYWFGGGWVTYRGDAWSTAAVLAVTLGGIATEWITAAVLALVARRRTGLTRVVLVGAAAGFAIHGGMYLSVGTFYGSGDGTLVHQLLGASRWIVWAPAAAVCVAAAYLGARAVIPELRAYAPVRAQLALVAAALVVGGAVHVGLLVGERALRVDPTYVAIMKTEDQRAVDREVAAVRTAHPTATEAELEAARRASEDKHRPFPFSPILIGLIAASAIFAASRTPEARTPRLMAWREVAGPAIVAAVGLAVVVILDGIF